MHSLLKNVPGDLQKCFFLCLAEHGGQRASDDASEVVCTHCWRMCLVVVVCKKWFSYCLAERCSDAGHITYAHTHTHTRIYVHI